MYGSSVPSDKERQQKAPVLTSNGRAFGNQGQNGAPITQEDETYDGRRGGCYGWLDRKFSLRQRGTTVAREFRAGTATFLTMSYIVIVNARVAGGKSGIPSSDVMIGTAASSAIGSFVCGYFGNLPFALAPGLGLSAYMSIGLSSTAPVGSPLSKEAKKAALLGHTSEWQSALAACAVAGIVQMFMARRLSSYLMRGTPRSVQVGTVVGMGLLLAFVALSELGIVEKAHNTPIPSPASNSTVFRDGGPLVQLGSNAYSAETFLACFGLVIVTFLAHHEIAGSVLIAVGLNTVISIWLLGTQPPEAVFGLPIPDKAFMAWDFGALTIQKHLPAVLAFILVGVFDIAGVLIGLSHAIGLDTGEDGVPKGSSWAFFAAGLGTLVGAAFGSTPLIVHLESAAGLTEGGRTGLTSVVVAFWFLCCLFAAPLLDSVPPSATSPVLFFVGSLMMGQMENVDWKDPTQAIPAFTAITVIPFTFSVPNGVFFGAFMSSVFAVFDSIFKRCRGVRVPPREMF